MEDLPTRRKSHPDLGAEQAEGWAPALDALAARVRYLEDERAILRTLYHYGHAIDYGEEQAWVDCFTADGVFDVRYEPGTTAGFQSMRIEGAPALAAFIARHPRAPTVLHKHMVVEPIIDVDGARARSRSYFELLLARDGQREIFAFGRYLDEMVRCPDGRWRFALRVAETQSAGLSFPDTSRPAIGDLEEKP